MREPAFFAYADNSTIWSTWSSAALRRTRQAGLRLGRQAPGQHSRDTKGM